MNQLASMLPANIARQNFYKILNEVSTHLRQFTITHRGKQQAVVMSAEEFAGWQETLEILSNKSLVKDIRLGLKQLQDGKGIPFEKAKKMLRLK